MWNEWIEWMAKRHQIIEGWNESFRWESLLFIATEKIGTGTLGNAETKKCRVNLILVYYHTTNYRTINIVKVHRICINYLWRSWSWFSLLFTRMGTLITLLLAALTSGSGTTTTTLWFVMMAMTLLVFGIAARATTNFTSCWGKFCFSYILRYLANARFTWLWKRFHTIFATSISCFKFFFFFLFSFLFLFFRMIFRILASENKILFGAAITSTSLTTLIS